MAVKQIVLGLPIHLKKFLEFEFKSKDGVLRVEKSSWLGNLIQLSSIHVPYTQKVVQVSGSPLTIQYYCREKVMDIPNDKLPTLTKQIEKQFRFGLEKFVLSIRFNLQCDYSPYIDQYVRVMGIEPNTQEEKEWEKVRKIYRDKEAKVGKENQKRFVLMGLDVAVEEEKNTKKDLRRKR